MTTVNTDVVSLGQVGAGNEYIYNSVIEQIQKQKPDLVLVQWATSNRLDLIVDSEFKQQIIATDMIYKDHIFDLDNSWWLSSASSTEYVKTYHENYIGTIQHRRRTVNYILALQSILTLMRIPYVFFSTYELDFLDDTLAQSINWENWVDQQGMENYSRQDRFSNIRLDAVQPSPTVHLDYVLEQLKPRLNLTWNEEHITKLRELFEKQDWHGLVPHYISRTI
jgi:hypothetical protein